MEGVIEDETEDDGMDEGEDDNEDDTDLDGGSSNSSDEKKDVGDDDDSWSDVSMADAEDDDNFPKSIDPKVYLFPAAYSRPTYHSKNFSQVALTNKTNDPLFKGLPRSKGFVWLATRPGLHGEWLQAGTILTLQGGCLWSCVLEDG